MPFQVPLRAKEGFALAVRFHFGLFGLGLKPFWMFCIVWESRNTDRWIIL
jgi:hypothetical protein